MIFDKISIKGFRGIKNLQIDNLSNVNVFVGKNNSSKTSILEAIYVLAGVYNPNLLINVTNFRNIILDEANDLRYLFYNLDYTNKLEIDGERTADEYVRSMVVTPNIRAMKINQNTLNQSPALQNLLQTVPENVTNELKINFTIKERHKKAFVGTSSVYHAGSTLFNAELAKNFIPDIKANFIPLKGGLSTDMAKILNDIIINKDQNIIIESLKKIDDKISNISLGNKGMVYLDIMGIKQLIPIDLSGDGMRKIFTILLGIYESSGGVLFIDEIENGLHFSALKTLWNTILKISKQYNVQVFVTTHNYETLKCLKETLESEENINFQKTIRSFTIRKLENLEHKAYCYEFPEFENAIKEGIEIR
jgi:AAA15 family ATPase/GTPase